LLAALVWWPGHAAAQDEPRGCEDGDVRQGPLQSFPASGAKGVRLDAPVRVEFSRGFFNELGAIPEESFSLTVANTGEPVPGSIEVVEDTLIFTPRDLFFSNTEYEARASGVGASRGLTARFVTGDDIDRRAPVLGPIERFTATEVGADASCATEEGSYRIDVTVLPAVEDGPAGDVEYLLFLARGPGIEEPRLVARERGITEEILLVFNLPPEEVAGPICVAVQAVDGVGNIDDDNPTRCEDPIQGNFFEPLCAVSAPGLGARSQGGPAWPVVGVVAFAGALLVWGRRRRRRPR
jgi:hypothetical protein